ncbi:MAG: tRNA-specific 2-thiouridylase MnmA, partial [uncultured Gemmatimonadetes bacterium]
GEADRSGGDVGGGGLVGGGGAARGAGAPRDRRDHEDVLLLRGGGERPRQELLRAGRDHGRAKRGGPARHPALRVRRGAGVHARRDRRLRAGVRLGAHSQPLRALQRQHQVPRPAAPRGHAGLRRHRHRPLRADGHGRRRPARAPARRGRQKGPELLPVGAPPGDPPAAHVPAGRAHQAPGARKGPRAGPRHRREGGEHGDLLRPHRQLRGRAGEAPRPRPRRPRPRQAGDDDRRGDRRPRGIRPLHRGPAQGPPRRPQPPPVRPRLAPGHARGRRGHRRGAGAPRGDHRRAELAGIRARRRRPHPGPDPRPRPGRPRHRPLPARRHHLPGPRRAAARRHPRPVRRPVRRPGRPRRGKNRL